MAVVASLFVASVVMAGDKQLRLTPAAASGWMQGQSALFFSDEVEQIGYSKDSYYVLGFAQSSTTGAYGGLWEASRPLSAINAEEFSKLGVDTVSLYDLLPAEEIPRLVAVPGAAVQSSAESAKRRRAQLTFDASGVLVEYLPPPKEGEPRRP